MLDKPKENLERPSSYQYIDILRNHLGDIRRVFNGEVIYPRQLEIHLPGDHKTPCNFSCIHCQGKFSEKTLSAFEQKALRLMEQLNGRIPYMIFGGVYTEPLLNSYFLDFLEMTKKQSSSFGIHTNGSLMEKLENESSFLTKLVKIATEKDYFSLSLDAGRAESHSKTKNLSENYFDRIIRGLEILSSLRGESKKPRLQICYLLNKFNSSEEEIDTIVEIARKNKIDSLRFSIPYDHYGKPFEQVEKYRKEYESKADKKFSPLLKKHISKDPEEKPFIFYFPPDYQDVCKMNFRQCIYGYYQITIGSDGFVYRCSCTAAPLFKFNRLGEIPDNLSDFEKMLKVNQDPFFNASSCFKRTARCNRMALEINDSWREFYDDI